MTLSPTLRSIVTATGELRLSVDPMEITAPGDDEVIVRVEATPINPSDIGLLLAGADPDTCVVRGEGAHRELVAQIPQARLNAFAGRFNTPMTVGNEGAGTVVAAGANQQSLMGRRVSVLAGGMYTQFRKVPAPTCVVLPDDVSVVDAASMFVNPLTALAMIETMKREGHTAIVHTAAASNLGQMLNRVCKTDGIGLVNIVRSPAQVQTLRRAGAQYVVDSSSDTFKTDLTEAVAATGATIAFDAIGGGKMANHILHAMEAAALRKQTAYSLYGSDVLKQIYIYGSLDVSKTELDRGYGFAWSVAAFLVRPFLRRIGLEGVQRLRDRVLRELKTTFASHYTATIGLQDLLVPDTLRAIAKRATGEKYLIDPSRRDRREARAS